ncbi:MAG: cytochrome c oxidase subunit, partial [Pyrinomonadaceae bacterium]|nr:cytochrome c oxidase subunit [Pyrinomonadaceae bacterium]
MEEATTPIEPSAAATEVEASGTDAHAEAAAAHAPHGHHGPPTGFIRKYIFSIDHKVIGIQYLLLAIFAAFTGMFMSVLMRLNLTWPGHKWTILETIFPLGAPGGVMTPEFYPSLVTMHGTMMVFFVLTTAPQGGF